MDPRRTNTETLTVDECWALLAASAVGRLAVDVAGRPDIFPVNYMVDATSDRHPDGRTIVFRTGAGTKLAAAAIEKLVAFEIDGFESGGRTAWSVVVKGEAEIIERMEEVFDAQNLPLFPWIISSKPNFVRVSPSEVTGRRFHVADEVAIDTSIGWNPTR